VCGFLGGMEKILRFQVCQDMNKNFSIQVVKIVSGKILKPGFQVCQDTCLELVKYLIENE
jgi:hypothetical protein